MQKSHKRIGHVYVDTCQSIASAFQLAFHSEEQILEGSFIYIHFYSVDKDTFSLPVFWKTCLAQLYVIWTQNTQIAAV